MRKKTNHCRVVEREWGSDLIRQVEFQNDLCFRMFRDKRTTGRVYTFDVYGNAQVACYRAILVQSFVDFDKQVPTTWNPIKDVEAIIIYEHDRYLECVDILKVAGSRWMEVI